MLKGSIPVFSVYISIHKDKNSDFFFWLYLFISKKLCRLNVEIVLDFRCSYLNGNYFMKILCA